ncbi:contact-dependent growth inhibition system immunity protein [Kiloniella sp.]|uniref:contact-dependent growth inhibition system immunity protein n=1 Tax=Kiloniella sp. TaxID=1938587 RepID=UPI003B01E049
MKCNYLTLEQLEDDVWPEPDFASRLVTTCHKLRKKPLADFDVEDLRIMIGQNIGLRHLLPMAIDKLRKNPLCEGDFYDGDLLSQVITRNGSELSKHTDIVELVRICEAALVSENPMCPDEVQAEIQTFCQSIKI